MKSGPNIGRIHNVVGTYYTGACTYEEVIRQLGWLMASENHVADSELAMIALPTGELDKILTIIQRVEIRVSAVARKARHRSQTI